MLTDSPRTIPSQYSANRQTVPSLGGFGTATDRTKQGDRGGSVASSASSDLLSDSFRIIPQQYPADPQTVPPLGGFGATLNPILPNSLFGSDNQTTPKQFAHIGSFSDQDSFRISGMQDKPTNSPVTRPVAELGARSKIPLSGNLPVTRPVAELGARSKIPLSGNLPVTRPVAELGARSKIPLSGNLPKELKNPLVASVPISRQKSVRAEVHNNPFIGESDTEELEEFSYSTPRGGQFMPGATGGLINEDILQQTVGSLLSPEVASGLEATNPGIYQRVIDEQLIKTAARGTTLQVTKGDEHLGLEKRQTTEEKSVQAAMSKSPSQDTEHKHYDLGGKYGVKGKVMRNRSSSTSALDENVPFTSDMLRRHRERLKSTSSSGILDEAPGQMKHVEPQLDQSNRNTILMSGLRPVIIQDARSRSSSDVSSDDIRKLRSQSVDDISDIVKEDHDTEHKEGTGNIRDAILGMSRSVYGSDIYKKHMNDAMKLAQQSSQQGMLSNVPSFAKELSKIAKDLQDVSMCETNEKNVPLSHTPSSGKSKTGASKSM